jgi:hypothetical protein
MLGMNRWGFWRCSPDHPNVSGAATMFLVFGAGHFMHTGEPEAPNPKQEACRAKEIPERRDASPKSPSVILIVSIKNGSR